MAELAKRESDADDDMLPARLRSHVEALAGRIGPRHVGARAALDAAAEHIAAALIGAGYAVSRQTYIASGVEVSTLIAELPAAGRAEETVILGAHYDTVPESPGADDNASAVAVLIETARALREVRPRRTIRFVAFPCEEHPHFERNETGSQQYARRCRAQREQIVGMLCLEMLGYYVAGAESQQIPPSIPWWIRWALPRRGDFLAAVGNVSSWRLLLQFRRAFRLGTRLRLLSLLLPASVREMRRSDNSSFWDQGYPALMITDTSFLRNPHYHRPSDTPETLDYGRLAQATQGVTAALLAIAGEA